MAEPGAALLFRDAVGHMQAGRKDEAARICRKILTGDPRHAESLHMLGVIALEAGDHAAAIEHLEKAVAIDGAKPAYRNNLGGALTLAGRWADAVTQYRKALELQPAQAVSHHNLADVLMHLGQVEAAADAYRKALTLKPDRWQSAHKLGLALSRQGQWRDAATALRSALALRPEAPEILNNLGIALKELNQTDEAIACYRRALEIRPDDANALRNLGNVLYGLDRFDEAIGCYQTSLELAPDATASATLLTWLHYSSAHTDADILKVARLYAAQVETQDRIVHFGNVPDPQRRLRIGYVSPDFRTHPVGFFLEAVLKAHAPEQVEIFCYSNEVFEDELTARLKTSADHWANITAMSDPDAAALIARDGIDILVDLTGHNDGNRLALFGARAAPVQVAWLGFYGTTGLCQMDYILADGIIIPPGEEPSFSENVWRLPGCYLCYSPPRHELKLGPGPAAANGFVTFGSFNKRAKLTAETIAAWAQILKRVEGSRLLLKDYRFADADCRARLLAMFEAQGIAQERITLEGHSPPEQALAAYNRMDIALDPFPFGGCTTTADTLWMGVPLVTLAGTRWTGRMSQSILTSLGLQDWIASDAENYIEIACELARTLPQTGARAHLRQTMAQSGFCDGQTFTRKLEAALRGMWQAWCAKTNAP